MLLISHRGNICGKNLDLENTQSYIQAAIKAGFMVECDMIKGRFWGHDDAKEKICHKFIEKNKNKLVIHCKDLESLRKCLSKEWHCFFHDDDKFCLSSKGLIISHSDTGIANGTICMLPEIHGLSKESLINCAGICSDIISFYG